MRLGRKTQRQPRASPKAIDFSETTVGAEVLKKTVTHPATVYPLALGALGVLGCALFGPVGLPLAVAIGGFAVGSGSWVVNFFFRGDQLTDELIADMRKAMAEANEQKRLNLRDDLETCRDIAGADEIVEQAIRQFDTVGAAFDGLLNVLSMKLNEGELTFGRFLGSANSVDHSVLDNLQNIIIYLNGIRSIDVSYIESRLRSLQKMKARSETEEVEMKALQERMKIRDDQIKKIREMLTANEQAITIIESSTAKIGEMKTGETYSNVDIDTAMQELKEIAGRASAYGRR